MSETPNPATPANPPERPHRRWPSPITLLLIGLFLLVIWGGLFAWRIHQRRELIAAVKASNGGIGTSPIGPSWLREWIGEKWFVGIDSIESVAWFQVNDEKFALITNAPELQELWVASNSLTRAGLSPLQSLHQLKDLNIDGIELSDDDLNNVCLARQLEELSVNIAQVSSRGFQRILELKNLKRLTLWSIQARFDELANSVGTSGVQDLCLEGAGLSGSELRILDQMKSLKALRLRGANVSEIAIHRLGNLSTLEDLEFYDSVVDARNFGTPKRFLHLNSLRLIRTGISNDELLVVDRLPELRYFQVESDSVTAAGIRGLLKLSGGRFHVVWGESPREIWDVE